MSVNIVNQIPYLRTTREFPEDPKELLVQINKTYVDIANAVNNRTISIYPINRPAIGGESWFIVNNQRQQNLRQVYIFTAAGNVPHGINVSNISRFSPKCYGSFTDGTNYYGAIFGSNVAIAGEISFYITSTNIVILAGAGAPAITSGIIVLEWLSEP